jgi:peptidoglycan hydrolase-like protein with peptidoglycan-binding domain
MVRCAIFILSLLTVLVPGAAIAQRVALVMGVADYQHVPKLTNAVNDATDIANKLRTLGFQVTLVVNPNRQAMEAAVQEFGARARGADAALFFYAGHAIEVQGRNWLIPISAELRTPQQLRFQTLEVEAITEQPQAAARVSLIILDACRDNPFRQRWPATFRDIGGGRGLARMTPPTGTLVVFSASAGMVAEDGRGRNSPFTEALLRHIDTPGLEVRPLIGEVRRDVREATGGTQVPEDQSSLEGSFFFRAPPAPAPVAAPAPPRAPIAIPAQPAAPSLDTVIWPSIANSRNPSDFEEFLRQFPTSQIAPFARNRLEALRREASEATQRESAEAARREAVEAARREALETARREAAEAARRAAAEAAVRVPPPPPAPAAVPILPVPPPPRALTGPEIQEAQRLLTAMGFPTGGVDGQVGPRSQEAMRAFMLSAGMGNTSSFDSLTLDRLRIGAPPAERRAAALGTLGRQALQAGDVAGARRLAAAGLQISGEADLHLLAGDAAQRAGDNAAARAAFQAAQRAGSAAAAQRLAALPVPPALALPAPLTQRASNGQAGWSFDRRTGCAVWNRDGTNWVITWSGACTDGVATGQGTLEWNTTGGMERWTGTLQVGERQGRGVLVWADGARYDGDWRNGQRTGLGMTTYQDGGRYEGGWQSNRAHGQGVRTGADGSQQAGDFVDGCLFAGSTLRAWLGAGMTEAICLARR